MNQLDLVEEINRRVHFDGITYSPEFDYERLGAQLKRVFSVIRDGHWYTLRELSHITGDASEAAISARLRDLRKTKFGGFQIDRRRRGDPKLGIWEYQMKNPRWK